MTVEAELGDADPPGGTGGDTAGDTAGGTGGDTAGGTGGDTAGGTGGDAAGDTAVRSERIRADDAGEPGEGWRRLHGPLAAWTAGQGPRLVFLHGFTHTAQSWTHIAGSLATEGYEAVLVDLPGHGRSAPVRADLRSGADLLATFGPAIYIGYSLGGRFALQTAFTHPTQVRALAVIGATPGIDDEAERAARRAADEHLARHIEDVGVAAFLPQWTAQALFGGHRLTDDDRDARLTNTVDGLASSLRLAGTGSQLSTWQRLAELTMPVLAMSGEEDAKFAAVARQIAGGVRQGRYVAIHGAAHAAHLQRPELVRSALSDWLRSLPR